MFTLVFSGNNFKYELEAVSKLFFPAQSFGFIFLDTEENPELPDDNFALIERTGELLRVAVTLDGKTASESLTLPTDTEDYENECEFQLGKLLFLCLRALTGISPEWGILTGVRPVKLINKLRAKGFDFEKASAYLADRYLMTDEKINIGWKTAENQDAVVSAMPKRSFSLYVDIPFCPTRCTYCSFISQTVGSFKKLMPEYVEKLCKEIAYTGELVKGKGMTLDTVYFGGGTPTSIEAKDLDRIMKQIASSFDLSHIREYTVEAGRPDTITSEKLDVIKSNGGDRVSINPQTLNEEVLKSIGRTHTVSEFLSSYELAKSKGFKAINVDLIAGLPDDKYDSFTQSVDGVMALNPENITVHALSIKRASELMSRRNLGDGELCEKMIKYSTEKLMSAGYSPYYLYRQKNQLGNQENIGWTLDGYAGIYNINIMEEVQTILSVGAGGTTKLVLSQGDGDRLNRFFNPKYPLEYIKHFDTVLSRKEEAGKLLDLI